MPDDYELATRLVREAGQLAATMRSEGRAPATQKTSISDLVTAADHAAEALIRDALREARPDDGLIGEEGTNEPGERMWYADPVDGTYNFASGLPIWCSAVALVDATGLVLGAIYQPETDELWIGGRDRPATLNGTALELLSDRPLAEISLSTYLHPNSLPEPAIRVPLLRVMKSAATVRMLGSGSVELAAVAGGRLGAWLHRDTLPWDWLPGAAIVRAAAGRAEVFESGGVHWHIAGSPAAVAEIIQRLTDDDILDG